MIILDASAALELILDTDTGGAVRQRILSARGGLASPHLLDVEVGHVLRRYERTGDIEGERAQMALVDLADLTITRYPHTPLLPRMWEMRMNLTFYDAAYVALAEALSAPLLTCDTKLSRAPNHRAQIEVLVG